MKKCQNCGFENLDDSLFCENCGTNLGQQQQQDLSREPQKKNTQYLVLSSVFGAVVLLAVLLFVFWDKLPLGNKDDMTEIQEVQEEEREEDGKEQDLKETVSLPEHVIKEPKKEETADGEDKSYADAEINGVDDAYVYVEGTVEQREGLTVLKLPKKMSVCALDPEEEIVQGNKITYFVLDGDDINEILGSEVSIKGKLSAGTSGDFYLEVVKLDVEQEAPMQEETDYKSHRYQFIVDDVTWGEAYADCKNRGGYLVQFNSQEEFQEVTRMIEEENMQNIHFYLGGRRDLGTSEYYWIDSNNSLTGEVLNPGGSAWAAGCWMENEPSYLSEDIDEMYMNLVYYQERWVLNDVGEDITMYYPGKTGYICEFEE